MLLLEPRLDIPTLWLLITCILAVILACYFCRKARLYKKELNDLKREYQNLEKSLATPINSKGGTITAQNQFTGNHS